MDTKLFKAFTVYKHRVRFDPREAQINLEERTVEDPSSTSWRSIGFTDVLQNELLVDLQGGGHLACVLVNDRVLPGAVIREGMASMIASITERDGRKPSKKQYAEIKDQVVHELLPKAFIRRKYIPVYFGGDNLIVFTSSAKLADDVMLLIQRTLPDFGESDTCAWPLISRVEHGPAGMFKALADDGAVNVNEGMPGTVWLQSSDAVVLKLGKKTIRVKDISIDQGHIQKLLEQDYEIVQMAIEQAEMVGDVSAKFLLNEHLVFSGFVLPNQGSRSRGRDEEDFVGAAWLIMDQIKTTINQVVAELGGLKKSEATSASSSSSDDDDDL